MDRYESRQSESVLKAKFGSGKLSLAFSGLTRIRVAAKRTVEGSHLLFLFMKTTLE